ncbi:MAG: LamG domain-containing protein [bacterium]|nr:LamG domain-containing protein [bacterium]
MKRNKHIRYALLALLLMPLSLSSACAGGFTLPGKEFAVDAHTLFLAHYNDGLDADYAMGIPLSTGNMALTEGRFGRGVLAVKGLIRQENLFSSPFFRMLRYDHQKNFDVNMGTLEMWVKPSFSESSPLMYTDPLDDKDGDSYNRYMLFHIAISPGNRQIALYLRKNKETGATDVVFQEMTARNTNENLFLIAGDTGFNRDTWHHIAVVWNNNMRAVYIDGKRSADRHAAGGLPLFGPTARPMAIGSLATYSDLPAQAVIDEIRISDVVRYQADFHVPLP